MKALRMLFWLVSIVIFVFLSISIYVYFYQKHMVFYPVKDLDASPDELNIAYEDVYVRAADDVTIHAWYIAADSSPGGAVLFCHGNAGNISHRLETIDFLQRLGFSILIFDYRGYGMSTGEPSESGVYNDARSCYEWLKAEKGFAAEDIVVFGRSLGGAVAIDLASKVPCRALVVESSFTSAADMARKIFPFLPTGLILRYKFDSVGKIEQVRCPVLVTHSPDDDLIPYSMGQRLYERASQPKQFVNISGYHNDRNYLNGLEYRKAFESLLIHP